MSWPYLVVPFVSNCVLVYGIHRSRHYKYSRFINQQLVTGLNEYNTLYYMYALVEIGEEIVFHVAIPSLLPKNKYNRIISSVLFGLVHMINYDSNSSKLLMLNNIVMASFFRYFVNGQSLGRACLYHMGYNRLMAYSAGQIMKL